MTKPAATDLTVFDQLSADVTTFLAPLKDVKVTDVTSRDHAHNATKLVKELIKKIDAKRLELTQPHQLFVKSVQNYAGTLTDPLEAMEKQLKRLMVEFEQAQEASRQAELKRLADEQAAREKAIAEERRKAEAAERARIAAEEKRIAAELKAAADLERKEREEAESLFGAQSAIEKKAADDAAELARQKAESDARARREKAEHDRLASEATAQRERDERERQAKAMAAQVEASRLKGITRRWTFEVSDPAMVPREWFILDNQKVQKAVNAGLRELPGIRIFQETGIAVGGRPQLTG